MMKHSLSLSLTKFITGSVVLLIISITLINLIWNATMDFQTAQYTYTTALFSINNLIAFIALLILVIASTGRAKVTKKWLPYLVLIIITVISGLCIWQMIDPGKPTDSFDVYQAALSWYETGKPSDAYFVNFPYQFGLIQLIYFFISIFHQEAIVTVIFRCINLIALVVIGILLLDLTRRLTDYSCTFLFILLYSCFFAPFLLVTFIYGDLIGLCFALLSVWFYCCNKKLSYIQNLLISLFFLLVAIYFRLNSSLFGIALAIYSCFTIPGKKEKIFGVVGFVVVTLIGINIGSIILDFFYHIETYDIPMIARLAMGLDAKGAGLREPGWYNGYIITLLEKYGNNSQRISQQAMIDLTESIHTFISQPSFTLNFFSRKFASMFLLSDFEGFSMNFITYENTWNFFGLTINGSYFIFWYNHISRIALILICIGSLITVIYQLKCRPNIPWLLMLILLGGVSYHMLFEAKARYVLPYILLLIPLATLGIRILNDKLVCLKQRLPYKPVIISICTLAIASLMTFSFFHTILPTLFFQAYTDTQTLVPLNDGNYYRYPITIESQISITDISLLTFRTSTASEDAYVQVDLYDSNETCLLTQTIQANSLQDKSWTTISVGPTSLESGDYFIQVSSNNPSSQDYGLILGNQFGFINEKNILLNKFDTNLQGNIKLYKNH